MYKDVYKITIIFIIIKTTELVHNNAQAQRNNSNSNKSMIIVKDKHKSGRKCNMAAILVVDRNSTFITVILLVTLSAYGL